MRNSRFEDQSHATTCTLTCRKWSSGQVSSTAGQYQRPVRKRVRHHCHARFIGRFYAAPLHVFSGARMYPRKTDLARLALQSHAAPLAMRERQALILCDGRRSVAELGAMLGTGAAAQIERLCAAGYLIVTAIPATATAAATESVSAPIHPAAPPAPAVPIVVAPAPAASSRRSIVAAKLYVIGMLELQRHESAVSHRTRLQTSQDPDATVAHILAAVHCLQLTTSASFAQRVRERLAEVLPEPYLPALEQPDPRQALSIVN
jgi:hypothetical protein